MALARRCKVTLASVVLLLGCTEVTEEVDSRGTDANGVGTSGAPAAEGGGLPGGAGASSGASRGGAAGEPRGGSSDASGAPPGFECEETIQVQALGAEGPTGAVDLTACLEKDHGSLEPVRVDRTGPELCGPESGLVPLPLEESQLECLARSDCAEGQSCLCSVGVPGFEDSSFGMYPLYFFGSWCVPSECESSADCGGYACGFSSWRCAAPDDPAWPAFYCRTPEDECQTDADCDPPMSVCLRSPGATRWVCSTSLSSCDFY